MKWRCPELLDRYERLRGSAGRPGRALLPTARCVLKFSSRVVTLLPHHKQSIRKEIGVHSSILIVDDNPAIRQAVRRGFERRNGFEICGEAVDGRDAIEKARLLKPDLVSKDESQAIPSGFALPAFRR